MAIPMATMEFAALCLDNALLLLPSQSTATPQFVAADASSEQRFKLFYELKFYGGIDINSIIFDFHFSTIGDRAFLVAAFWL